MFEQIEILPLGGLKEIGKNCMLIKAGNDAIMIDCGMGFPGNDDFMEDDFFIPDFDDRIDYEAELVVKINRIGRDISEQYAHRYYDEISVGIDFTARNIQSALRDKICRFGKTV